MHHRAQKGFCGISVVISKHQKLYLVYVPSTRKIISSHDVVFYETFSSTLTYTSQLYTEAMAMRPNVLYTSYATSSKEKTGDIITFTQFEEENLLSETGDDAESIDKSDYDSVMPPLSNKEEMDEMDSVNESEDEHMFTEM